MEGSSEKEKRLMDMDNTVVIGGTVGRRGGRGGRGYKGISGNEKDTIRIK